MTHTICTLSFTFFTLDKRFWYQSAKQRGLKTALFQHPSRRWTIYVYIVLSVTWWCAFMWGWLIHDCRTNWSEREIEYRPGCNVYFFLPKFIGIYSLSELALSGHKYNSNIFCVGFTFQPQVLQFEWQGLAVTEASSLKVTSLQHLLTPTLFLKNEG